MSKYKIGDTLKGLSRPHVYTIIKILDKSDITPMQYLLKCDPGGREMLMSESSLNIMFKVLEPKVNNMHKYTIGQKVKQQHWHTVWTIIEVKPTLNNEFDYTVTSGDGSVLVKAEKELDKSYVLVNDNNSPTLTKGHTQVDFSVLVGKTIKCVSTGPWPNKEFKVISHDSKIGSEKFEIEDVDTSAVYTISRDMVTKYFQIKLKDFNPVGGGGSGKGTTRLSTKNLSKDVTENIDWVITESKENNHINPIHDGYTCDSKEEQERAWRLLKQICGDTGK